MDFDLTETQHAVREAASETLRRFADPERLAAVEASDERFDRELWEALARSGILGLAVPVEYGGGGLDLFEVAPALIEHGRRLCPVPLLETVLAASVIARFGDDRQRAGWLPRIASGAAIVTVALDNSLLAVDDDRLTGTVRSVPYAQVASAFLVPGNGVLRLVESVPSITSALYERTDRAFAADLALDGAPSVALGDGAPEWLRTGAWLGLAAVGFGVAHEALAQTATYLSARKQFGAPLATFQAAAHQAANCHIDVRAMEVTLWSALWRWHTDRPAAAAAHVAKWWAAEAGDRVARTVQHLHGGIGADVTYPIHRYMLWTSQLANTAGGASWHLAQIGDLIATGAA